MSSSSSGSRSAERRRSHSTPQKHSKTESFSGRSASCDVDNTEGSPRSFSPIYHDTFESENKDRDSQSRMLENDSGSKCPSDLIEQSLADMHLSPWEMWLLNKERKSRIELQKKLSEEMKLEEERRKAQEKKELQKRLAEEQHKDWVRRKQEQERKEKEEKLLKEKQKTEVQEQRKSSVQERSKEKYQEWLSKKKEEEQERKRKEKEEGEMRLAEQRAKKEQAEQIFQEWLEQAKNKPLPTSNSYGYVNGKLTGYYDGSSYPAPTFYNPVPWKPIHVPQPPKASVKNPNGKKKKRAVSSLSYRPTTALPYKPKDNLHVGVGMIKR
ncbi:coiled-coil domain-containing protein 34 [Rana temporaria]|uniref:coiled-coil domain-containing protein 34 n=1 Tax=Rana temporaria TaxID=8407 RepID=UPI001AAD3A06|nr:coiled-coil domain-containing protein 34 [Rana temporaria]XP_040184280.1 coiled-coil domain-containing protein 34 [Rana temporaria]